MLYLIMKDKQVWQKIKDIFLDKTNCDYEYNLKYIDEIER